MALQGIVDEKYLIYETQNTQRGNNAQPDLHLNRPIRFWSDRYVLILNDHNEHFWNFTVIDLFMNDSRQAHFRKSANYLRWIEVFLIGNGFGFVIEHGNQVHCVSLVKTDWSLNEFQVVDQFERQCMILEVLMDPLKPTKFVLKLFNTSNASSVYQVCNVIGNRFKFGETREINIHFHHCSGGKLIRFQRKNQKFTITSYSWSKKQEQIFDIEFIPERFKFVHIDVEEWRQAQLNSRFHFQNMDDLCMHLQRFNTQNGHVYVGIKFSNGNFIVSTKTENRRIAMTDSDVKIYSIPIQRPPLLRDSAWIFVVNMMKRKGEVDPYQAAMKYLPFNTDLRSAWFENKGDDEQNELNQYESMEIDGVPAKKFKTG